MPSPKAHPGDISGWHHSAKLIPVILQGAITLLMLTLMVVQVAITLLMLTPVIFQGVVTLLCAIFAHPCDILGCRGAVTC